MPRRRHPPSIWTIGHSTRSLEEFLGLLKTHGILQLVDIRRIPGSRRYPHFGQEPLRQALEQNGILYHHFPDLGGRRSARKDSQNTGLRNASFRGYADHMETPVFREAVARLMELAEHTATAVMCAEAVWWRCHRALLADYLKASGIEVLHILSARPAEPHPFTSAARIEGGTLTYAKPPEDTRQAS